MVCIITIVRYPKCLGFAGVLSMALFRLPLWLNRKIAFWKLMGTGRSGGFDSAPNWRQWAILQVRSTKLEVREEKYEVASTQYETGREAERLNFAGLCFDKTPPDIAAWLPRFIRRYHRLLNCQTCTLVLTPLEGHGLWDGKQVFGHLPKATAYDGIIAVLTRATIKPARLRAFWKNVDGVAAQLQGAPGLLYSLGAGEVPFVKQATLSIWQGREQMKQFAYHMRQHRDVIQKTRQLQWYSEEMFVRFKVCAVYGALIEKNTGVDNG